MSIQWDRTNTVPPDDVVYIVTAFHDTARQGVTLLDGALWLFESVFDDREDEYSDMYLLSRLPSSLQPVLEQLCQYEYRWSVGRWYGLVPPGHICALPEDQVSYGRLLAYLNAFLHIDIVHAHYATVRFVPRSRPEQGGWIRATWTQQPAPMDKVTFVAGAWRIHTTL